MDTPLHNGTKCRITTVHHGDQPSRLHRALDVVSKLGPVFLGLSMLHPLKYCNCVLGYLTLVTTRNWLSIAFVCTKVFPLILKTKSY